MSTSASPYDGGPYEGGMLAQQGQGLVGRPTTIAAIVMLLIFSHAWVYPLVGGEAADAADPGSVVRALYFPAYLIGGAIFLQSARDVFPAIARQPFLIAIALVVALSVTWSISPEQTARRAFAFYFTTLAGVVIGVRFRWAQLAEVLAATFAILAVLSLLTVVLFPSVGIMSTIFPGAWCGLWSEKNTFGGNMTMGAVIMLAASILNPQRRLVWCGFAALAIFLVLMSTSKTALICLLPGLGALAFVSVAGRGPTWGVVSGWLLVLVATAVAATLLLNPDLLFSLVGKDATFTGRTKIWTAAMRQVAERPWTGYGYGVFWAQKGGWGPLAWIIAEAGFKPQHAHNTWLEQLIAMGVLGLTAFSLFFIQTIISCAVAVFRNPGAYLALPFFVAYSLTTLTESVGAVYNDLTWVIFCAFAVALAGRKARGDDFEPEEAEAEAY